METSSPAAGTARLAYVDILRGFALIGVFAANLLIFSGYVYMDDAARARLPTFRLDRVASLLETIFIENKFIGLFAFLFGVSFWLFLDRARARGANGQRLFYRRLGWLFVIGAVHGWLFWCFDVLRFYALWGLLLPLFLKVSQRKLLWSALFFAILVPAWNSGVEAMIHGPVPPDRSFDQLALRAYSSGTYLEMLRANWRYDWRLTLSIGQIGYQVAILGRLLLGLWAARAGILAERERHKPLFRRLLLWGGLAGVAFNVLEATHAIDSGDGASIPRAFFGELVAQAGYLSLSLAYASALALLLGSVAWARRLSPLGSVGQMALTCYLLQTAFGLFMFYGFPHGPRLMGRVGSAWLVAIWVVGYAIQLVLASAWLRRYRFGPAEWVWRSLTYGRVQPFRLAERQAA